MSNDNPDAYRNGIAQELNTVMAGEEPLTNLKVVQAGINVFKVLSARNGGATVWEVNLKGDPSCTCPDMDYNQESGDVCAHVAKAMLVAESTWDAEIMTTQASLNVLHEANQATERVRELEELVGRLDEANRKGRDPGTVATDAESTTAPEDPVADLKDALDNAGIPPEEMQVEDVNDYVAFAADGRLSDDQFSNLVDFTDRDPVEYSPDSDGPDNRIKKADVPRVA